MAKEYSKELRVRVLTIVDAGREPDLTPKEIRTRLRSEAESQHRVNLAGP